MDALKKTDICLDEIPKTPSIQIFRQFSVTGHQEEKRRLPDRGWNPGLRTVNSSSK